MSVFKIFQSFLSLVVFLFIPVIAGIVFWQKKFAKKLIVIGVVFCYLFSITPVSDALIWPLERQFYSTKTKELSEAEYIVLLTGGVRQGDLSGSAKLGESTLFRAARAAEIFFKRGGGPVIIISGLNPVLPEERPALEIARFFLNLGIPSEKIELEESSKNTYQSALNLSPILENHPFFLVTSAYHLPRSIYIFKEIGLNPMPAPADFRTEKAYGILDFFPSPKNLKKCDLALHEYFGMIYYKIRY